MWILTILNNFFDKEDKNVITSKQRAFLRGEVSLQPAVCFVGKDGLSPSVMESIKQALTAREVVKISVLQNCEMPVKDVATSICTALGAETVGIVGKKIVVYKFNAKNKSHALQNMK